MSRVLPPALRAACHSISVSCQRCSLAAIAVSCTSRRAKGDYGFNVFHNSNPQHGASYARHERRMRDDEVEDFMRSVKGWVLVREVAAQERAHEIAEMEALARQRRGHTADDDVTTTAVATVAARRHGEEGLEEENADVDVDAPPAASPLRLGEEAIQRTFHFSSVADAYLFMGRFWAFCYGADKYPPVTWEGCSLTVQLYAPSFHGLSKREARVAAFLNDQYNMLKKSRWQREKVMGGVAKTATVEELVGEEVRRRLAAREAARRAPLPEAREGGPVNWEALVVKAMRSE